MATVTMDINELDKLRSNLKEQEELVKEYKSKEKQVKVTLANQEYCTRRNSYGQMFFDKKYIEKIEYLNFEDVKSELKKEAESSVIIKLGNFEREVKELKSDKESLKTKHQEEVYKIKELFLEEKKELLDKIKEFEGTEVEKTKDKLIYELSNKLKTLEVSFDEQSKQFNELKSKNWYQKLFNI